MYCSQPRIATTAALSVLLSCATACRQASLSLPVAQAAGSQTSAVQTTPFLASVDHARKPLEKAILGGDFRRITEEVYAKQPSKTCYAFMHSRPKAQRAAAVQARLQQADQMSAALDSEIFSVELVGDHANVLLLQFPAVWPVLPGYAERVNSVVREYFSVPDIEDYLCNSGFAEVRLSAKGVNDNRIHPIWTARVTSEGLVKIRANGRRLRAEEPLSVP